MAIQTDGGSGVTVDPKIVDAALRVDKHRTLLRERSERVKAEMKPGDARRQTFSAYRDFEGAVPSGQLS